jgi:pyridoxine kinase
MDERGVLAQCDGVLSGYIGDPEIGEAVLDAVTRVKRANPNALYCCDPVIGDVGKGAFVREGVAEFMRDCALPAADVATPNAFELECLTGHSCGTLGEARGAVEALHARGPRVVLVTSLQTDATPPDMIEMLTSSDAGGAFFLRTPKLPGVFNGAGDLTAALFFAHYLQGKHVADTLSQAASAVFGLLNRTAQMQAEELQIVAAQEEIVAPRVIFQAERLP